MMLDWLALIALWFSSTRSSFCWFASSLIWFRQNLRLVRNHFTFAHTHSCRFDLATGTQA